MKILFVSVEVAPFAKVGGLADVAGSLPKALAALGHDVRIVMPDYAMIENSGKFEISEGVVEFETQINSGWKKPTTVRVTDNGGVPVYLLGTDEWFCDADRSENVYAPGIDKYLFFSSAVLQMFEPLGWAPDILHCHDWHTGLVPVLLREKFAHQYPEMASVFTIHNLAYQGEFDIDVLDKLQLPHRLFNPNQVEAWGRVNFLKAGAACSDRVNTVSENYAREIQTPEYGCGLDGLMRHLSDLGRLSGILNGIDQEVFNPSDDPDIYHHFDAENLKGKAETKAALLKELDLEPMEGAPLLGVVSRLSSQKGLDLIAEAAEELFDTPIQLVVLGAGDKNISDALNDLKKRHPKNLAFVDGFKLHLAPRIYGGCDGFLMPSKFEPCGLGQMIALRYGTVPLVRPTGGLADTVFEGKNGFVMEGSDKDALVSAVKRLKHAYDKPKKWKELVKHCMGVDFGWANSAEKYQDLYEGSLSYRLSTQRQTA